MRIKKRGGTQRGTNGIVEWKRRDKRGRDGGEKVRGEIERKEEERKRLPWKVVKKRRKQERKRAENEKRRKKR